MTHISRLPLFLLLATAAAAPAFAQLQEGEKPTQEQVAAGEAPAVAFDESERVIQQNIVCALGLKLLFILLAVTGVATLWMAIAADMGASLLVMFNGLRLMKQ